MARPEQRIHTSIAALVVGLGAFLLFAMQPIVGKYLLPWFGGAPGVWSTCLVFFQILLLGGYLYAHLITTYLTGWQQKVAHLSLLALTALALPTDLAAHQPAIEAAGQPVRAILMILVQTIGLPYFVLATTSPLIQKWFSRRQQNPYRLYALSNLGSLGALLCYPVLFEPLLSRSAQIQGWSILCWSYLAIGAICTLQLAESKSQPTEAAGPLPAKVAAELSDHDLAAAFADTSNPPALDRMWWIVLPAIASMLLLGVTNKLCQDLAPFPMLWLLPLVLYLLSFILCFDHPRWYRPRLMMVLFPLGCAASLIDVIFDPKGGVPITAHLVIFNVTLFIGCMLCHGELARRQPQTTFLTHYYLSLATGGALGGMAIALGAPLLLRGYYELPITLLLCLAAALYSLAGRRADGQRGLGRLSRAYAAAWFGCLMTLSWASVELGRGEHFRNFYGVVSVVQGPWRDSTNLVRLLQHGQITHGTEFLSGPYTNQANTYYGPHSGIGRVLGAYPPGLPKKVGVLGLGIGNLGVYAQPQDTWVYYEINPAIIALAQNRFDELRKHPCQREILLGDARQTLARQPIQNFDCLIVDVFSGDSIPTHLLTKEAIELYCRHLKSEGTLALHISNRYLDLEPVVRRLADHCGLEMLVTKSLKNQIEPNETMSVWVTLTVKKSRDRERLRQPVWTDDYTAILPIVRWGGRE